jgi:hypothetical protein
MEEVDVMQEQVVIMWHRIGASAQALQWQPVMAGAGRDDVARDN